MNSDVSLADLITDFEQAYVALLIGEAELDGRKRVYQARMRLRTHLNYSQAAEQDAVLRADEKASAAAVKRWATE